MTDTKYDNVPGVVHLSKERYAVNLLWNQVPQGKSSLKFAKESAKVINTSLICLDTNLLGQQYGLADKRIGHKAGMKVLATQLDYSIGALCGAWEFEGGIWLVLAINRDGIILSDKGVYSQESAMEEFHTILYSDEWDKIICPKDWQITHSSDVTLNSLFVKKKCRRIRSTKFPIKSVICIFTILSGSFLYFLFGVKNQDAIKLQPPTATNLANRKDELPKKVMVPWSGRPRPISMVEQCVNSIDININNAVAVPGWAWSGQVTCDGENVFYPIVKNGGTLLWLQSADQIISPAPRIENVTGNSAVLVWPASHVKRYREELLYFDNLSPTSEIKDYLKKSFSQSFSTVDFGSPSIMSLGGNILLKTTFSYETKLEPGIFLPILVNVEGLVVSELSYSSENGEWRVSGDFYGRK